MDSNLVTTSGAATILGCSPRHVMYLANKGDLPVEKYVGMRGDRRFRRDVIQEIADSGRLYRRPGADPVASCPPPSTKREA